MTDIFDILGITGPITIVALIGYFAVKFGLFPQEGISALFQFTLNFALPFAIFKSIVRIEVTEIFNLQFFVGYTIASLILFFAMMAFSMKMQKNSLTIGALSGLGSVTCNAMMIGFPIVLALFDDVAIIAVVLVVLVQDCILLPLVLTLAETGNADDKNIPRLLKAVSLKIIKTPLIIAITLAIIVSVLGITPPEPAARTIDIFAKTIAGVGLFAIGGMLANAHVGNLFSRAAPIFVAKLMIHPALVFVAFYFLPGIDPELKTIGVILASLPMIGIYAVLSANYGDGPAAAAATLSTTALSFITLSAIIWLLAAFQPFGAY